MHNICRFMKRLVAELLAISRELVYSRPGAGIELEGCSESDNKNWEKTRSIKEYIIREKYNS